MFDHKDFMPLKYSVVSVSNELKASPGSVHDFSFEM